MDFLKKNISLKIHTQKHTHVTIVCFMFFNSCTNKFWGGGRGILVGGWGGVNFQRLQTFHSNIGRNACLT